MYNAQSTIERVQSLIKQKGDTQKRILEICGLDENTLKKMTDKRGIASFSLAKIADELNCSVDYLLGRTNDPLSHKERSATLSVGNDFNNKGFIGNIGNNNSQLATNSVNTLDENDLAILSIYKELPPFERAKLMVYANDLKGGANEI